MWYRHWGLSWHPFEDSQSPYVSLPSHDEALYRLIYSIEQGNSQISFIAESGLGKTRVLKRAISETRSPRRRIVLIRPKSDPLPIPGQIAERLGHMIPRQSGHDLMWRAMVRAVRIASLQGCQIVLIVEEPIEDSTTTVQDLNVLTVSGIVQNTGHSLIRVGCTPSGPHFSSRNGSSLIIGLKRLTRSQVEDYLIRKLTAAGCADRVFTPRSITRLHAHSLGILRDLEQLAALCMMAGAIRGLEVIPPDVVDGIAQECGEFVSISSSI